MLRRAVVQGLQVMGDEDVDVCCSGADAPAKVRLWMLYCLQILIILSWYVLLSKSFAKHATLENA